MTLPTKIPDKYSVSINNTLYLRNDRDVASEMMKTNFLSVQTINDNLTKRLCQSEEG